LMSRQLIEDEVRAGRLMQPFGPEMEGKPFHLVYPESRRDDPTVLAVRDWVMGVPGGLCAVKADTGNAEPRYQLRLRRE